MQVQTLDYVDARARCGTLLSEAAFGDSPAREACTEASLGLAVIASYVRDSAGRARLRAA